jgi:hypothetical protein
MSLAREKERERERRLSDNKESIIRIITIAAWWSWSLSLWNEIRILRVLGSNPLLKNMNVFWKKYF